MMFTPRSVLPVFELIADFANTFQVSELDLFDAGMDVEWTILKVPDLAQTSNPGANWEGIRRPYWCVPEYRLPTCKFVG